MKRILILVNALIVTLVPAAGTALAQTIAGPRAFEQQCATCHKTVGAPEGAQDEWKLRRLSSEEIFEASGKGTVHTQPGSTTEEDRRLAAEYLGARKVGVPQAADAKQMRNHCAGNPTITSLSANPMWNGWGNDLTNARFQPAKAAGLTAAQVPQLKLKWAFGLPMADEVYGQPTVAAGRVFFSSDAGAVYSVDAATGCVYWSFQADAGVRSAISIGPVKVPGTQFGIYFGDLKANVYMLNATTGKQIWKVKVEEHPVARITGAPSLYQDRLYVPVSSLEERAAGVSTVYPCCTFRGSIVALDANTGKQIWKTYTIPEEPKPIRKTSKGIQQYGPAGGAVWNAPTLDPAHHTLYVGTGDAYVEPATKTTDGVMAFNMDNGKILWATQDTENDAWLSSCPPNGGGSENCPKDMGPDFDFGASPILRTLPDGHRILVAGQKSGMVWAHDADKEGTLVWKVQLVDKLALGMITFGGAADDQNAYFGLRTSNVAGVKLATGERIWNTPIPAPQAQGVPRGETAALTVIPGVVFSGGWDGVLRAFSTEDGRQIWEYNTVQEYKTVNGVPAKGGSMASAGTTVAGGMLFVGSGYIFGAGVPGNTLLAFSVQ